jgi:hypothetical protein
LCGLSTLILGDSISTNFNFGISLPSFSKGTVQLNIEGNLFKNKIYLGSCLSGNILNNKTKDSFEYFAQNIVLSRFYTFNTIGFYVSFEQKIYKQISLGMRPSWHRYTIYQYANEIGSPRQHSIKHNRGQIVNIDLFTRFSIKRRLAIELSYFRRFNNVTKYYYELKALPYPTFDSDFVNSYPLYKDNAKWFNRLNVAFIIKL